MNNSCLKKEESLGFLLAVINAMPVPVFVVDEDVSILSCNTAAANLAADKVDNILRKRSGEVLGCINSTRTAMGCGHADECRFCIIRNAVNEAFLGEQTVRKRTKMMLVGASETTSC